MRRMITTSHTEWTRGQRMVAAANAVSSVSSPPSASSATSANTPPQRTASISAPPIAVVVVSPAISSVSPTSEMRPQPQAVDDTPLPFWCALCQGVIRNCVTIVACNHSFCATCLAEWIRTYDGIHVCPHEPLTALMTEFVFDLDVDAQIEQWSGDGGAGGAAAPHAADVEPRPISPPPSPPQRQRIPRMQHAIRGKRVMADRAI